MVILGIILLVALIIFNLAFFTAGFFIYGKKLNEMGDEKDSCGCIGFGWAFKALGIFNAVNFIIALIISITLGAGFAKKASSFGNNNVNVESSYDQSSLGSSYSYGQNW